MTCAVISVKKKLFYGGPIAEEVYPAILGCDGLVMVCPNYNDALSANLTAFINRMTALFTTHRFYDKALFGVIVFRIQWKRYRSGTADQRSQHE